MKQEKTPLVLCLKHYLNCFTKFPFGELSMSSPEPLPTVLPQAKHFNRASVRSKVETDKVAEIEYIQRRLALEYFVNFLKNRDIEFIQQVDLFILDEYRLHLEELLSLREHSPEQHGEYKHAIEDFLNYCAKSLYLPENPAEDIL